MALLLPHSLFLHIPKTGGTWVRRALMQVGLARQELRCARHGAVKPEEDRILPKVWGERGCCLHNHPRDCDMSAVSDQLVFAFVRHPFAFAQSYWAFKMYGGWDYQNRFDEQCGSSSFERFLENALRYAGKNGWVSSLYEAYLGTEQDGVEAFVGHQERLTEDLVAALRIAGEEFDEQALRSFLPINTTSPAWKDRAVCSESLLRHFLETERRTLERFGYGEEEAFASLRKASSAASYDLHAFPGAARIFMQKEPESVRQACPEAMLKTGVFVGRFQPFHEGHKRCVEHILQENDRCIILLRDTEPTEKNPFDVVKRIAFIRAQFPDETRVLIQTIDDPDADLTIYIGRDVGYKLIQLDAATEAISATDIRKKLYTDKEQAEAEKSNSTTEVHTIPPTLSA